MYIESLKSVSSRCQANTVELTKSVASIKERITEKGNSVCNTIKSQSEELMNIVEKESERIKEEYLKSATASADLEKDVVTLMDQAKAERNALENREKNGDIAMETILAILKKIDDLKNKVESVKMGSSFSHKVLIVDGGYPKIAFFGESSVLLNLLLGEEYLATSSKEQEGEHRQLAYIPSDVFELRCQKENHRNFEYLRLNEKDKAWSCDRCKVDGTVDYDDIKDKKLAKLEATIKELKDECTKLEARNKKNAENEKALYDKKADIQKIIDKFFCDSHELLEAKKKDTYDTLNIKFEELMKGIKDQHKSLRLFLSEGRDLLQTSERTLKDYAWAKDHPEESFKPPQQLIIDIEHIHDKKELFKGKISSLEEASKGMYMKIDFNQAAEGKLKEAIELVSVAVENASEQ